MKRLLLIFGLISCWVFAQGQSTLSTVPPLAGGNGASGIAFEIESTASIIITDMSNDFDGSGTAELWFRLGGVEHIPGQAPDISTANGWVQHWTGAVSGTGGTLDPLPGWTNYTLPAGQRVGVAIFGVSMDYSNTGTSQPAIPTFTDGTLTIYTGLNDGYGGNSASSWPNHPRQFNGSITYIPAAPCTAPPVAGTAEASDSLLCVNNPIQLSLLGAAFGTGQTYQWEQSLDGGVTWTTMINDTLASITAIPTDTTDYRCIVTCSGQSDTSGAVTVNTIGSPLSGVYTINSTLPTGGTNFNSFSDFATAIECGGVTGPVTVNVAAGTYAEQVTLNGWTGGSATNTVTIQPDPANPGVVDLTYAPAGSGDNFTLDLNGVSFTNFFGINISSTGSAGYSRVITLEGIIDEVYFDGVQISGPQVTSTSTFHALVYEDANPSIGVLSFSNCNFLNGSNGVYLFPSSADPIDSIVFLNNTFDNYNYGIYTSYAYNFVAIGNDIQTQGSTTNYGIRAYGNSGATDTSRAVIRENNIRLFGTGTMYGIYTYYFQADSQEPSEVINNMVYCSPNSTGTNYPYYHYHNANMNVFHNTFHIEAGSTSSRPIYVSASTSSTVFPSGGVDIRNNIFTNFGQGYLAYVTGGADDGGYFSAWNSNLYFGGGSTQYYYSGSQADFTAWNTATGFDNASTFGDPLYVGLGDLHVIGGAANDAGDNSVNVLTDIDGDTRPFTGSTVVDIGADEYEPQGCLPPVNTTITAVTSNSAVVTWTNGSTPAPLLYQIEYGPAGFVPGNGTVDIAFHPTTTYTISGLTDQTDYDFYITEICSFTDSSLALGPFSFTTLCNPQVAPYTENFDAGGWIADPVDFSAANDQFDVCWSRTPETGYSWRVRSGTTGSSSTGPNGDNTTDTTNYIYTEASGGGAGDVAEVYSPLIDISALTNAELSFYFHAYGSNNPAVFIEVWDGSQWNTLDSVTAQIQTSSADPWLQAAYNISSYPDTIQVRWRAISNACCSGDFAIDDVVVDDAPPCPDPSQLSLATLNPTGSTIDVDWTPANPAATTWEVEYGPVGFTQGSGTVVTVNAPLPATIPGLTGFTEYDFYVREACVVLPGQWSNWVGPVSGITAVTPPYLEDFSTGVPPFGWTEAQGIAANPTVFTSTSSSIWINDGFENNGTSGAARANIWLSGQDEWLISPPIDLSTPGSWELLFDGASTEYASSTLQGIWEGDDSLMVLISLDNGVTWNRSDNLFIFDSINPLPLPGTTYSTSLAGYSGVVRFAFYAESQVNGSEDIDMFVDNFEINTPPACPNITFLQATGVSTTTSVEITWVEGTTGATSWEVEYGPAGFAQGTGTVITATAPPFTVPGLAPATTYDFYVREQCPNGVDFSNWIGVATDATQCAAIPAPWTETFDGATQPALPNCWTTQSPSNPGAPADDLWAVYVPGVSSGVSPGYALGSVADHTGTGGGYAWVDASTPNWPDVQMETPDIDVSTLTSPALEFYLRSENNNTPNDNNTIIVDIWDGAAWNDSVLVFQDDSTDWFHIYVPLNNIIFTGPMRARITMDETTTSGSSFYNDILIDDISVIEDTANQVQVLCDDFDGYTTGGLSAQSNAWESWAGGAEDADVVSSPTFSGAGAMRIHETGTNGVSDIVYQMGDLTTGSHEVSFYFNIPTANGGYFNLMHDYDGGTAPVFAIEVLFDGTNGTGQLDFGSSGGGNIANFGFTPGTWNRMQIIVDLDADQAEMLVNGFSVATWIWSDGQGGVYESLGGIDFFSTAPGALTSLMYVDEFCFGDYVPACLVTTQPTGSDVDGCEGQATTLTATAGDTSNFVVWLDNSGQVLATGSNYTIDSLIATTTANAVDATELGAADHVGPLPSIATDGFGNFTNGTFITVYNTVRVDSMLIKSDGAVDMGVNFWSDDPSNGGVLLQTSASASLPGAGEHQIAVNITLQPGTYFANVRYDGGAGQLFRATGGATFPYVLPDLISLDSINFVNQQRFYYLFDWVVTPVCLGTQPTAITANLVEAPSAAYTPTTTAGSCEVSFDASASVGDTYAWDFGDGSGASGATPTHTYSASGTYDVTLVVSNSCGNDTVVQQVTVDCIGLREDFLSSLNAYPNPTTDVLNIVFELQNRQDVQVRLMNSLGQIVYGEDLEAFSGVYEHQLSLENQAKGVYMLQVTTANGTKTMRVTLQ